MQNRQYMAVTDIHGAFLHADMDPSVQWMLERKISEQINRLEHSCSETTHGTTKHKTIAIFSI